MKYEWDEAKRQANIVKHGVDFADIVDFDWTSAYVMKDMRREYGESRWIAYGYIEERRMALVFTMRQDAIRVISLRKANAREERCYE